MITITAFERIQHDGMYFDFTNKFKKKELKYIISIENVFSVTYIVIYMYMFLNTWHVPRKINVRFVSSCETKRMNKPGDERETTAVKQLRNRCGRCGYPSNRRYRYYA